MKSVHLLLSLLVFTNVGFAQNVGIGTTTPVNKLHITNNQPSDGGASQSLLIENTNTTASGEAAVVFKNAGTAGTGAKNWFIGLNQNRNFTWAYGSAFFNSLTKMVLDSTGSIGLGTLDPNNSAIADFASTTKGVLLPRLSDTNVVVAPVAGLVMYNQATKSPNYYDGAKWNDVAEAKNVVPLQGSITYTITGTAAIGGIAIDQGALAAIDYSGSSFTPRSTGGGAGKPNDIDSIIIYKEFDPNSIVFKRAQIGSNVIASMEISQFLPNAATPFYSIKLTSFQVLSQSYFISDKTGKLTEKYGLVATTIGFKDWVSNKSFSYTPSTVSIGTY